MITRRRVIQAALISLPLTPAAAPFRARPNGATLSFVFSRPFANPRTQWLIKVYRELCGMLGFQFAFRDVPPRRATAMVLAGQVDGELGRTFGYQTLFPALVRVAEPNNAVNFCAYVTKPALVLPPMEVIRSQGLRCECRRGILELESFLAKHLRPEQISQVGETAQGLRKLQLGRSDLYFEVQEAVQDFFDFQQCEKTPFPAQPAIRNAGLVLATTGHCYLNQSRAALAPAMAAALREMKSSGRVAVHLNNALREHTQSCHPDS